MHGMQPDLFDAVTDAYAACETPLSNTELYSAVADRLELDEAQRNEMGLFGQAQTQHNKFHHRVRWAQQALRDQGILTRVDRGQWTLTGKKRQQLHAIKQAKAVVAMSTSLGIAICCDSIDLLSRDIIDEPIALMISSPPYPLRVARAYGNPEVKEYIDWLMKVLKPIAKRLVKGGSMAINLGNDIFVQGSPQRSTYVERLLIRCEDELGLYKMDTLMWQSNKCPGPTTWAHVNRMQLHTSYEPILWLCNSPLDCFADNRRVLQPHSERMKKLMASGGQQHHSEHGDGAYVQPVGSFGRVTEGKIPTNTLKFSNYCPEGRAVNAEARTLGLPPHAAKYPQRLAEFLIGFLSRPSDLVVDPFGGTLTSGAAAQKLGRRWVCLEQTWEYIKQGFRRFAGDEDTWVNPAFANFNPHR
ncbi:site-specific DNA-methyltransferase [Ferrimonas marina]|uniref:Methyltransferase n=1 Tax=Ferrimonas marina TaxID=299255 RepID=A0A1M5U9S9_9GAMM|nr:site-specific DNA-methyltransferase [Ferrimonas marina]SHH59606.1 site-specific DNA-methyltransferase (cytosine-N4-specific) [Ferrimonas marina]